MRMACAALAALLIGGAGAAHAAGTPHTSVDDARVVSRSTDHVTQATLGRNQPCPGGWVCLYEHAHFNHDRDGRMLKFRDDYWQLFSDYGFQEQVSSWKNRLERDACLSWDWPPGSRRLTLAAEANSAAMGDWNDRARGVKPGDC